LSMNARVRCLTAILFLLACSGTAFGQTATAAVAPSQVTLSQWGNNVLVTCMLTQGQSFETLFSNNVLVSDMVGQWKANFEASPPAVAEAEEIGAALEVLVRTFALGSGLNWTAQDILIGKWADLPGSPGQKKKIRAAYDILKEDGLMCLSFLDRGVDEEAPQGLVTAMVNVLGNPRLAVLTHLDLYTKGATVEQYSNADMDLLSFAMDEVHLIRTAPPDGGAPAISAELSGMSAMGASAAAAGQSVCCSRATRTCVSGGVNARCSLCGSTCCLGSTWCST
jgi:hypothetical protein